MKTNILTKLLENLVTKNNETVARQIRNLHRGLEKEQTKNLKLN